MYKFILSCILIIVFSFPTFAETWSCTYIYDGETRQKIVERIGAKFHERTYKDSFGNTIVKENDKFIHLYSNIDTFETAYLTVLDKENQAFVMVGIAYEQSTDIIEGPCVIYY